MSKKWIQSMGLKKGAFTAQANRVGMSVPAFTKQVLAHKERYSPTTVKRANLARTFSRMRK